MPNKHKDLPTGSQAWADELDAALATIKKLEEVVRRLSENAGIDYSNPKRGINPSNEMPSTNNPVGQKLSSLADVQTYDIADKQVLTWSQKDQKWLPVTPPTPSAGGEVDISAVSYAGLQKGYGYVTSGTDYAYTSAEHTTYGGVVEIWASDYVYIGQMHSDYSPGAIIELSQGSYDPWISLMSYGPGGSTELLVVDNDVKISGGTLSINKVGTASRPALTSTNRGNSVYDEDLKMPIWWHGPTATWRDALGNPV